MSALTKIGQESKKILKLQKKLSIIIYVNDILFGENAENINRTEHITWQISLVHKWLLVLIAVQLTYPFKPGEIAGLTPGLPGGNLH